MEVAAAAASETAGSERVSDCGAPHLTGFMASGSLAFFAAKMQEIMKLKPVPIQKWETPAEIAALERGRATRRQAMSAETLVSEIVGERMLDTEPILALSDTADAPITDLAAAEAKLLANLEEATAGLNAQWHSADECHGYDCNPEIASFERGFIATAEDLRAWFEAEMNIMNALAALSGAEPCAELHLNLWPHRSRHDQTVIGATLYARFGPLGLYLHPTTIPTPLAAMYSAANKAHQRVQVPKEPELTPGKRVRPEESDESDADSSQPPAKKAK